MGIIEWSASRRIIRPKQSSYQRLILLILALGCVYYMVRVGSIPWKSRQMSLSSPWNRLNSDGLRGSVPSTRITRVSMLYGKTNHLYERAIDTHTRHSKRWGNDFHVLRQNIISGFWNKPSYLLSILYKELEKPSSYQAEWLMWVDADAIIINPAIPPQIFLPPGDLSHIHLVASRDQNGLNTGIFFLRVHPWSAAFLMQTIAFPLYRPDVDLGRSADQEAMLRIVNMTVGGHNNEGFANQVVYIPRKWINTYEWHHAYEGVKGDMLVHMPGLEVERWRHMADWLDAIESKPQEWEVPLETTDYWNRSKAFWMTHRRANRLCESLEKNTTVTARQWGLILRQAIVKDSDDAEKMQQAFEYVYQNTKDYKGFELDGTDKYYFPVSAKDLP